MLHQLARNLRKRREAPVDDQRFGVPYFAPIGRVHLLSDHERHCRRLPAVRERHPRVGRDARRRRDAWNDFKRNPSFGQRLGLFSAVPE
jgi:hypothetical protein